MTTNEIHPNKPKKIRLFFADHLRAALVILVVLHHVAMVYGGIQPFYYLEPPASLPAFLVPMAFVLLNQGWFMGALFLLAGYFTPGSYDRKGAGTYLKDRLIRLGIPMVVFYFVLSPISGIGYFLMSGDTAGLTWDAFWSAYPDLIGLGPLWFVAMLLIFDFGYVGWRLLVKKQTSNSATESSAPTYLGVGIFVLALALVSYLVRIVIPLGKSVLDFPTLAYLPQYLSFFVIGTIAYRRDWLRRLPGRMGIVGFVVAMLASFTLFALGFVSFLKALENAAPQIPPWGFGTWQSAVYALWDSIFAVGMTMAAITFFRRFFNKQSGFGTFLAQQSYTVYVIHIPVVVFLAYALRGVDIGSLLKFGLASLMVLIACFMVAFILRKIPGVSRVL
jgi:surface polysaccharide O-acyltransferase-like enzyme